MSELERQRVRYLAELEECPKKNNQRERVALVVAVAVIAAQGLYIALS